jgi:hypothetical protein
MLNCNIQYNIFYSYDKYSIFNVILITIMVSVMPSAWVGVRHNFLKSYLDLKMKIALGISLL